MYGQILLIVASGRKFTDFETSFLDGALIITKRGYSSTFTENDRPHSLHDIFTNRQFY